MKKLFTKNNKGYLSDSWLVLVLAFLYGVTLVGVDLLLGPKIAENKLNETLSQVPVLIEGSSAGAPVTIGSKTVYPALDSNGSVVGWVVPAGGEGFVDRIELLIGLDRKLTKIEGLYVLDQKETPGLGSRITEDAWRSQFSSKTTQKPISITKNRDRAHLNEVRALSGATISSKSVAKVVNETISLISANKDLFMKNASLIERQK